MCVCEREFTLCCVCLHLYIVLNLVTGCRICSCLLILFFLEEDFNVDSLYFPDCRLAYVNYHCAFCDGVGRSGLSECEGK